MENKGNKFLIVGGDFNLDGGRPSSMIEKIYNEIKKSKLFKIKCINGGHYDVIVKALKSTEKYNFCIWCPNIPNNFPKLREVKEINPKIMLITSKRNIDNKYQFSELINRALNTKSNLCIEFSNTTTKKYNMQVFDVLGNTFYNGQNIEEMVNVLIDRIVFLSKMTRTSTYKSEEFASEDDAYKKLFKGETKLITPNENKFEYEYIPYEAMSFPEGLSRQPRVNTEVIPREKFYNYNEAIKDIDEKKEFIDLVKEYAPIFAETTFGKANIERFLGNASFRCLRGFPSFKEDDYIYVSRRNVDKTYIGIDEFVPVYLKDNKIQFIGENKPSVDTPVQLLLYKIFPNIKYMIHCHCYIDGAPFTKQAVPCGALEEVEEITNILVDVNKDFYVINLLGHGAIMMSNDVEKLKGIKSRIVGRKLPEFISLK